MKTEPGARAQSRRITPLGDEASLLWGIDAERGAL
jgi:hypothetical protein